MLVWLQALLLNFETLLWKKMIESEGEVLLELVHRCAGKVEGPSTVGDESTGEGRRKSQHWNLCKL